MSTPTELDRWLHRNWDPDLSVGEWWDRLGLAGWATPTWPSEWFGKGLSPVEATQVQRSIVDHGALPGPAELGVLLAGPTILVHGTDEQRSRLLPDIVTGRAAWCQLFSEPVAGSDLAGLQTRAEVDGDEWVVNGQKVWTSSAHLADLGMLIARTDSDAPKHKGITYFVVEMHQPGIDIRPLREMTGRSLFNEVFLSDVRVQDRNRIGDRGAGWRVTNTTLAFERSGLGAGSSRASSAAHPGSIADHLGRRAGDMVEATERRRSSSTPLSTSVQSLISAATRSGRLHEPLVRQELAVLHTLQAIGGYNARRHRALRANGQDIPGAANLAKLAMSQMFARSRDLGLNLLGPRGMLHDYESAPRNGSDPDRAITELALWSPGPPIYGGSDQIQRNIIAERVLGLPRDDSTARETPFRDLPRNA